MLFEFVFTISSTVAKVYNFNLHYNLFNKLLRNYSFIYIACKIMAHHASGQVKYLTIIYYPTGYFDRKS